jgi:transcriptional regulator with XRE-family HTH domain
MTQAALAQKTRMSREHLNRLEAGRYNATVGMIQRIAKALGVSLTELLG